MVQDLFVSGIPYAEKALRTILVYMLVLVLLRVAGKRELAQLNTFDLVVTLLLSNVVQNAIIGSDVSVSGAAFGAAVLVGVNAVVVRLTARYERISKLLEGTATVLARNGRWLPAANGWHGMRPEDLEVAIRRQGGDGVADTALVTLEPGGTLVVSLNRKDQAADKSDIHALQEAIAELRRALAVSDET
ncbi:DUF421 domain-containing protein [Actinacidiphila acididurans]|uniref:DUF421 domain-containing protein n=1 Tax=Actinacidiphila acididurans TaxID=2784346 RepID=A0ABS2TL65_9ACTN|nr:YetF domain-containing protein [Actinacidiphila acididurans]MBM9504077.1 DUF421 domain-containing protein [Actinacidiphila acididurans]